RETVEKPPYAVDITGTSAFSRGSLFWTIDHTEPVGGESPSGFLRFRLEDESFSVTPPPPCCEGLVYEMSYLSELHGELSVAHPGPNCESIEIWTCNDVDTNPPEWTLCYIFNNYCPQPAEGLDIAMYHLCKDMFILQVLKDIVGLDRLIYHPHDSVIPYIPSLVPV
uniref:F-box associated domain-containing protein n=2 Tax=Aegilops tauschii subsp. strangulata TaxID=200361 RepID=A0A453DS74_AEGTS